MPAAKSTVKPVAPAAKAAPLGSAGTASGPPPEPLPVGHWVSPPSALSATPPPDDPSSRSWQALGFVAAAVLVLAIAVFVLLRPVLAEDDESDPGEEARTLPFEPPIGLPVNGSYVETDVLPSGDLRVTHWIHTKVPQFSIKLMAPVLAGIDSGTVTATGVEVAADGRVVPGSSSVDGVSQSYPFHGAESIYVTYVLSGAMELSSSVEGRALARVTALDLEYLSMGGESVRSVQGAEVLNLACSPSGAPDASPKPCGKPDSDGWKVRLTGKKWNDHVMAQLNLT
jgi:hypothetical protein